MTCADRICPCLIRQMILVLLQASMLQPLQCRCPESSSSFQLATIVRSAGKPGSLPASQGVSHQLPVGLSLYPDITPGHYWGAGISLMRARLSSIDSVIVPFPLGAGIH